jgi:hypothetical protein
VLFPQVDRTVVQTPTRQKIASQCISPRRNVPFKKYFYLEANKTSTRTHCEKHICKLATVVKNAKKRAVEYDNGIEGWPLD